MTLRAEEHRRRLELYQQGCSDAEIAQAVGRAKNSITVWRNRNGLARGRPGHPGVSGVKHQERLDLYNQGLSDTEIAERVGMVAGGICAWRKKHKLPSKRDNEGVHMSEALDPEECEHMTTFLRSLLDAHDSCMAQGWKINVLEYIKHYSGRVDESTHQRKRREYQKEKRRQEDYGELSTLSTGR